MIINALEQIKSLPLFFELQNFLAHSRVLLKLEGLNIAHSIKIKTAVYLINMLEQNGSVHPSRTTFICSSSGNFSLACSVVCKQRGYKLICVTDPNILVANKNLMRVYGAELIQVTQKDENGGYLATRIKIIEDLCKDNENIICLDQYANRDNVLAHYYTTAKEIHQQFPNLHYLFIGAGTTGTLMGCAEYFKQHSPHTTIVAVDSVGSVTFGKAAGKRRLPGLGTSRKPEIVNPDIIDLLIMVEEKHTIQLCRELLSTYGLLLGASSGTVLAAIKQFQHNIKPDSTIVCISPDFGEHYIDTVYNDTWVWENFSVNIP